MLGVAGCFFYTTTQMAETYFNTCDGRLYIGQAAIAEGMQQPDNDLVPLAELLRTPDFSPPGEYKKQQGSNWTREDCVALGQWVISLISGVPGRTVSALESINDTAVPANAEIDHKYIARLYALGIGPDKAVIRRRFGRMWGYAEALGVRNTKSGDKFRDWTLEQYVANAAALAKTLGRKPLRTDYEAQYEAFQGPGIRMIVSRAGGISRLNELIGYPNIRSWEEEDFIDWGVKVRLANEGRPFTVRDIRRLAGMDRGPTLITIQKRFGSVSKFQTLVGEETEVVVREQEEQDGQLMAKHDELTAAGELVLPEDADTAAKLRMTAKYLVVRRCLPGMDRETAASMAALRISQFIPALMSKNSQLTAGFVESTAVALGVFDYIWPMDEWRQYLQVGSPEPGCNR
jgi:hypothetical protein